MHHDDAYTSETSITPNWTAVLQEASDTLASMNRLKALLGRRGAAAAMLARDALGITQHEMARRLGISRCHICHIERGKRQMQPELAVKILRLLMDEKCL